MNLLGDPSFELTRASVADAPVVQDVIADAARWLLSRGIHQWEWFLTDDGRAHVVERIEEHECYLLKREGEATATITLQWTDEHFWGERGKDETAGYVHGLAVRRTAAGRGIGAALLNWASERCADRSRYLLRLDCAADNAPLNAFYQSVGFDRVEVRNVHGRFNSALYQRIVAQK